MRDSLSKVLIVILGLALGACASKSATPPPAESARPAIDQFELSIRVGRMGVMLDQGNMALEMLAGTNDMSFLPDPADDISGRRAFYAQLSRAVLDHNRLWVTACAFDASIPACQNIYEPGWLGLPFSHAPTWRQLDAWTEEMQDQAGSLSGALCAMAERTTGRRQLCPIE